MLHATIMVTYIETMRPLLEYFSIRILDLHKCRVYKTLRNGMHCVPNRRQGGYTVCIDNGSYFWQDYVIKETN